MTSADNKPSPARVRLLNELAQLEHGMRRQGWGERQIAAMRRIWADPKVRATAIGLLNRGWPRAT